MEYLVLLLYNLFLVVKYDVYNNMHYKKMHYYILLTFFILLSGLRYRISVDTINYMNDFEYKAISLLELNVEYIFFNKYQPAWVVLNSLCKYWGDSFVLLQLIISVVINSAFFYFFKTMTPKYFTAILFYFVLNYVYFNMDILREALAISMFLYAIIFYNKGQVWMYVFFVLLAFMFHVFAVILFFLPIVISEKISIKIKMLVLLVLFVLIISIGVQNVIEVTLYMIPEKMRSKIIIYLIDDTFGLPSLSWKGKISVLMPYLFCLFFVFPFIKKAERKKLLLLKSNTLLSLLFVSFLIPILQFQMPIFYRIGNYFTTFMLLSFVSVMYLFDFYSIKVKMLFVMIVVFFMLSYRVNYFLSIDETFDKPFYLRFYPYNSILEKKNIKERERMMY